MKENKMIAEGSGKDFVGQRTVPRSPRSIRFSDSEWDRIDKLAIEQEISSSELVRETVVGMIDGKFPAWSDANASALPAGIQTLIEKTYRGVYVLATLKRDKLYREERHEELNAVHEAARSTQEAIMESASDS